VKLSTVIDERYEQLSAELKRAAKWVRSHPAELGLQSLRQSAYAAGVSPATMSRLARGLGFESFEAMRRPTIAAIAQSIGTNLPSPEEPTASGDYSAFDELNQFQVDNLASIYQRNSVEAYAAAADEILKARKVLFLGLRSAFSMAYHLHYTCDWLRDNTAVAADAGGAWPEKVLSLAPPDLLVVVSQAPYTRMVVENTQTAADRGVRILAITDSELSPLARLATVSLFFRSSSSSFFHSQVGALALAERLMADVAQRGRVDVNARLSERRDMLQNNRAYWEKPSVFKTPKPPKTPASKVNPGHDRD